MASTKSIFSKIGTSLQMLQILDQFVDVDRLIGISNAQGPQAKLIKQVLDMDPKKFEDVRTAEEAISVVAEAATLQPQKKKRPKRLSQTSDGLKKGAT